MCCACLCAIKSWRLNQNSFLANRAQQHLLMADTAELNRLLLSIDTNSHVASFRLARSEARKWKSWALSSNVVGAANPKPQFPLVYEPLVYDGSANPEWLQRHKLAILINLARLDDIVPLFQQLALAMRGLSLADVNEIALVPLKKLLGDLIDAPCLLQDAVDEESMRKVGNDDMFTPHVAAVAFDLIQTYESIKQVWCFLFGTEKGTSDGNVRQTLSRHFVPGFIGFDDPVVINDASTVNDLDIHTVRAVRRQASSNSAHCGCIGAPGTLNRHVRDRFDSIAHVVNGDDGPQGVGVLLRADLEDAVELHVLTALHVVNAKPPDDDGVPVLVEGWYVKFVNESFKVVEFVRYDDRKDGSMRADWAVVKARGTRKQVAKIKDLKVWSLADDDGSQFECCGDKCTQLTILTHAGAAVPITIGTNSNTAHSLVDRDDRLQASLSGAPVVNKKGECVGLYRGETGVWLFRRTGSKHAADEQLCSDYASPRQ